MRLLRNKETGETVLVTHVGANIRYRGYASEGEIRADKVADVFDDISDPSTQSEIEAFLKSAIEAGDAETGLYNTGMQHVVVDRVDGEFTFQWFYERYSLEAIVEQVAETMETDLRTQQDARPT